MIGRRSFLAAIATAGALPAAEVRREVFLRSPGKGTAVMAYTFYTRRKGGSLESVESRWSRSDTIDVAYVRRSSDNGRTWSAPEERKTGERRPEGMLRRHGRAGFVDPRNGRFVDFWIEGVLPTDDPLEGLRQWNIFYRVSRDGRPPGPVQQVIHEGSEYTPKHALPGVETGKTCVMLGDLPSKAVASPDGGIWLPVTLSVAGTDGKLLRPFGAYTFTDAALLHGRWKGDALIWRMSDVVKIDPERSTRGADEPTVEMLDDGRILMVLRGSNDKRFDLPGTRWVCFSRDGYRWTSPKPWTFDDEIPFYSPSACSELLKHSSGRLFWLGNITPTNPRGNRPRYPFVIGEVDRHSGLLMRDTVRTIDTRAPGEPEILSLSNFYAREDRESKDVVLHMTRLFAHPDGWEGDAMLYRISV